MDALTGGKARNRLENCHNLGKNRKAPRSFPTCPSFPRQLTQLDLLQLAEVKGKTCLSVQALKA
jgi:hypothetical protein